MKKCSKRREKIGFINILRGPHIHSCPLLCDIIGWICIKINFRQILKDGLNKEWMMKFVVLKKFDRRFKFSRDEKNLIFKNLKSKKKLFLEKFFNLLNFLVFIFKNSSNSHLTHFLTLAHKVPHLPIALIPIGNAVWLLWSHNDDDIV